MLFPLSTEKIIVTLQLTHLVNPVKVHAGQPEKIRARLKTNKLKPSHPNGGSYPFEWWGEDVKNTFNQGAVNQFRLHIGFENGLSTFPLHNNFEGAYPVVIVRGAKIKYTLAPTTKNELTNLRVAIKDESGGFTDIVDRKITEVNPASVTIDNSDNKFAANDTTNNLKAMIYQIDENKNKQVLVNDYGTTVEQSNTELGYSSILLRT